MSVCCAPCLLRVRAWLLFDVFVAVFGVCFIILVIYSVFAVCCCDCWCVWFAWCFSNLFYPVFWVLLIVLCLLDLFAWFPEGVLLL